MNLKEINRLIFQNIREGEQEHKQSSDIEEFLTSVDNVNENLNEEQQPMQQ